MQYLRQALLALERLAGAGWAALDHPGTWRAAFWLGPLAAGLVSMALGQDVNWDLGNYHLYNPYALLNGRIGADLAPAQFQSYFNPTVDLLYYGLNQVLPAPATAFAMGWLHGFNFVLAAALARRVLPAAQQGRGLRLPLLLALAGCMGTAFLSQLGNTMGDNLTSLCVLGALLWLVARWPQLLEGGSRGVLAALGAGAVMGIGTGLKLTNANYALALCLALLTLPSGFWLRIRTAFVFGLGVLGGMAVSAGHWYWRMWEVFGNPLYPQFNNIFRAPLAAPIGVADTGWLPRGWAEYVFWPFIFTFNPKRVIELPMTQILWPMVYLAFIALALRTCRNVIVGAGPLVPGGRPLHSAPLAAGMPGSTGMTAAAGASAILGGPAARLLLAFFALSYLMWLKLFGIYRYLVPLELVAPLVFWLLLHRLAAPAVARPVAGWGLLLASVIVFPMATWGHAPYGTVPFRADQPVFPRPANQIVFTVLGDPPMGWMLTLLPKELAFVSLGSGFPESPAYAARVQDMLIERSGPWYMLVEADTGRAVDLGREVLGRYGLMLQEGSCRGYSAYAGTAHRPYRLCVVRRKN